MLHALLILYFALHAACLSLSVPGQVTQGQTVTVTWKRNLLDVTNFQIKLDNSQSSTLATVNSIASSGQIDINFSETGTHKLVAINPLLSSLFGPSATSNQFTIVVQNNPAPPSSQPETTDNNPGAAPAATTPAQTPQAPDPTTTADSNPGNTDALPNSSPANPSTPTAQNNPSSDAESTGAAAASRVTGVAGLSTTSGSAPAGTTDSAALALSQSVLDALYTQTATPTVIVVGSTLSTIYPSSPFGSSPQSSAAAGTGSNTPGSGSGNNGATATSGSSKSNSAVITAAIIGALLALVILGYALYYYRRRQRARRRRITFNRDLMIRPSVTSQEPTFVDMSSSALTAPGKPVANYRSSSPTPAPQERLTSFMKMSMEYDPEKAEEAYGGVDSAEDGRSSISSIVARQWPGVAAATQ